MHQRKFQGLGRLNGFVRCSCCYSFTLCRGKYMLAAVGVCARLGYEPPVVWPRHYDAHPCPMVLAARHAVGNRGLFDPSAGT